MKTFLALILCISGSTLIGCGSDDGDDTGNGGDGDGDIDCTTAPTYEDFGEDFVSTYCLGCHASGIPGEPDNTFDTHEDIMDQADGMADALMSGLMPLEGALQPSAEDREKAIQWLSCGGE